MEKRNLGRTDIEVSACCLGTMTWGKQNTEAEGHAQMDYAVERGVNFFDTAELYAIPPEPETQGRTEEIIGTWFRASGKRDRIVLATKIVGRSNMTWFREGGVHPRQTKEQIDYAVAQSLRRLQTDYIDLYQLHWPDRKMQLFGGQSFKFYSDPFEPFEAILEALDAHVQAGRIRHIGVSNESAWGVMRFVQEAEARGLPRIVSIQNAYNLVNRRFETDLAEVAIREDVGLLSYSPLGQGYLTAKYRNGALPKGSRKEMFQRLGRYEGPGADEALEAYFQLAERRGIDKSHMALKFCDTRPFMTSTIIGATTMEQLKTDIDAFDFAWSEDLEADIDAIHARYPSPCP